MNGKLQDLLAVLLFVGLLFLLFGKLFSGNVLIQGDILQYKGMSAEIDQVHAKTGEDIHWTNSMFGGMPTYLMSDAVYKNNNIAQWVNHTLRAVFPGPSVIFLISLLSFYILCRTQNIHRLLSVTGALGYGLSTFAVISLVAGHNSKIFAYAYAPLIVAGVFNIYRKKYWSGPFLLALGLALQIACNHFQITFYTFIICACFVLSEVVAYWKDNKLNQFWKPLVLSTIAVIIGLGVNFNKLSTIYKHSTYTIRGGNSSIANPNSSSGLDYDYATQWSYKPIESFTLVIPNFMGGSSSEIVGDSSHWANGQPIPTYWGDMPFTGGPVYIGAVFFALFLFALFHLKNRQKWWAVIASLLLLFLSWGKHSIIYQLFFDSFPMFNKFRTPMMALLLLSLLVPFVGLKGLNNWLTKQMESTKQGWKFYLPIFIALGIVLIFGVFGSYLYSFQGVVDNAIPNQLINFLKQDRATLLRNDSFRSLFFIGITGSLFYLLMTKKLKTRYVLAGLIGIVFLDLFLVDKRYLTAKNFETKETYEQRFIASPIDKQIQQDTSYYRVLNVAGNPFTEATTSLQHFSIGGYHAAKLQTYQDVIDQYLSARNRTMLNMLNAKYIIGKRQDGQLGVQVNEQANGNAWFASSIKVVDSKKDAFNAIENIEDSKLAVIEKEYANSVKLNSVDTTSANTITLTDYAPEQLNYKATVTNTAQLAVFSEVFYQHEDGDGWRAYIDGAEVQVIPVNYLLRAIVVPKGEHEVEFRFVHDAFKKRGYVSKVFSALLLLMGVGYFSQGTLRKQLTNV